MHSVSLLALCICALAASGRGEVIQLTDLNFDELVTRGGVWFIDVYAPWCSHCRELEPVWQEVARQLEGVVNVGKVDGTKERILMRRLAIDSFPSLFLIEGSLTRRYQGIRAQEQLVEFAKNGYREVEPVPFYKSPTSVFGRFIAALVILPAKVQALFRHLHEEKGYGTLTLLAGGLAVPLLTGLLLICALDNFVQSRRRVSPTVHAHVN
ncbi:g9756 [Coccomyxa viridis]|uniref:G9756 protein n=1 Tax=Coccomyxa viridis TaxID=1274662 RepID=A0ABP1G9X6_9CHLO